MGNASCCVREQSTSESSGRPFDTRRHEDHVEFQYVNQTFPRDETSTNFLPHISEREMADALDEADPSTHPSVRPTFMERSRSEMKLKENRRSLYMLDALAGHKLGSSTLRKSSSCSTIYLDDSTISQPHLKNTIKCIALAMYYHIVNRKNRGHERLMEIFEERLHPISRDTITAESMTRDPDDRQIYRFVRNLFTSALLTAECAIITLTSSLGTRLTLSSLCGAYRLIDIEIFIDKIYLERLLNYAEMDLCPSNWRRVVLASVMLASKVWDDQAVWNVDYCQILGDINVDDMNELERRFLECLDFNINVPSSVYAKYYFDLRTLAIANDLHLPIQPLYRERAKKLEALSRTYEDKMDKMGGRAKWSHSTEQLATHPKTPVVIS